MKIEIPFNSWSRARLREGAKTCTSRTKVLGNTGDTFEVEGNTYVLTAVEKHAMRVIIDAFYLREGAKDSAEMRRMLRIVLRTKQRPLVLVVHFFRRVEAT